MCEAFRTKEKVRVSHSWRTFHFPSAMCEAFRTKEKCVSAIAGARFIFRVQRYDENSNGAILKNYDLYFSLDFPVTPSRSLSIN